LQPSTRAVNGQALFGFFLHLATALKKMYICGTFSIMYNTKPDHVIRYPASTAAVVLDVQLSALAAFSA
jgi:hypothetical protein